MIAFKHYAGECKTFVGGGRKEYDGWVSPDDIGCIWVLESLDGDWWLKTKSGITHNITNESYDMFVALAKEGRI